MTGFAFSLVTLRADLHNSGTSLIAAMAIFFKAPQRAPSFLGGRFQPPSATVDEIELGGGFLE
ncbi:MAG: hypothetical protein H6935_15265 [Thiobacillus sp.]|nr:hypothetical protein [Thiobacillus sp.]